MWTSRGQLHSKVSRLQEHLDSNRGHEPLEIGKIKDRYVVVVLRDRTTVGHVPRKISAARTLFLQREAMQ